MGKGVILDKNGATYKEKKDIIALGGGKLSSEKKEEVKLVEKNTPLLTSEEMDIRPMGSQILARGFKPPEKTKGGIILTEESRGSVLPVLLVMKTGANVKVVEEGKWVRIKDDFTPAPIPYKDEVFFLFAETDVVFIYDNPPEMDHVMNGSTTIIRDLTQYVEFDKLKDIRADITERMEGEVPNE